MISAQRGQTHLVCIDAARANSISRGFYVILAFVVVDMLHHAILYSTCLIY